MKGFWKLWVPRAEAARRNCDRFLCSRAEALQALLGMIKKLPGDSNVDILFGFAMVFRLRTMEYYRKRIALESSGKIGCM